MLKLILIFVLMLLAILHKGNCEEIQCKEGQIKCGNDQCCSLLPNDHCDPQQCGENMECSPENNCQCKSNFVEYIDYDTENLKRCAFTLPSKCEHSNECGVNAQCSAQTKTCECNEGYDELTIEVSNRTIRHCEKSESSSEPVKDLACLANYKKCSEKCCSPDGECVNDECICGAGFFNKPNTNGTIVDCEADAVGVKECPNECGPNSQCVAGKCDCTQGFHKPLNSEECIADVDEVSSESTEVSNPTTETNKALCPAGYDQCYQKCCGANTACKEGECVCQEGFRETEDQTTNSKVCEAIADEESDEVTVKPECEPGYVNCSEKCCGPNTECQEGECVCQEGFQETEEQKTNSKVCEAIAKEETDAMTDKPECEPGYVNCSEKCCGPNAVCKAGECVCQEGFQETEDHKTNSKVCEAIADEENDEGTAKPECEPGQVICSGKCCGLNAECNEGECVCQKGFRETEDQTTNSKVCQAIADEEIHDETVNPECEPGQVICSEKCCGPNTECQEGVCVCQKGFQLKQLNDLANSTECQSSDAPLPDDQSLECLEGYTKCEDQCCDPSRVCMENTCVCPEGFQEVLSSGECEANAVTESTDIINCLTGYAPCSGSCCGPSAQCIADKCSCPHGFREKPGNSTNIVDCEAMKEDDHTVANQLVCAVDYAHCGGSICCSPNGQCLQGECKCIVGFAAKLNASAQTMECEPLEVSKCTPACEANRRCIDGECKCNEGLREILNECLPEDKPPIVVTCGAAYSECNQMCCGAHSQCQQGKCICPEGYRAKDNLKATSNLVDCVEVEPLPNVPQCQADQANCSGMCCGTNSHCVATTCMCLPGFQSLFYNKTSRIYNCERLPDVHCEPGFHKCSLEQPCCGPHGHGHCRNSECVCEPGFKAQRIESSNAVTCQPLQRSQSQLRNLYTINGCICLFVALNFYIFLCYKYTVNNRRRRSGHV